MAGEREKNSATSGKKESGYKIERYSEWSFEYSMKFHDNSLLSDILLLDCKP
jgi:hypothetical protein